jgi:hypothetical protein
MATPAELLEGFHAHRDIEELRSYAQQVYESAPNSAVRHVAAHYLPVDVDQITEQVTRDLSIRGIAVPSDRIVAEIASVYPTARLTSMVGLQVFLNIRNELPLNALSPLPLTPEPTLTPPPPASTGRSFPRLIPRSIGNALSRLGSRVQG